MTCSVPERATLAKEGMPAMPIAIMAVSVEGPHTAPAIIAKSSAGKASSKSALRITNASAHVPRRMPARMPSGTPTTAAIPTATRPTKTVIWAPAMRREAVSRPKRSVPRRCSALGPARLTSGCARVGSYGVHTSEITATSTVAATRMVPSQPEKRSFIIYHLP